MPDVPTVCLPLANELDDKQATYDALRLDLQAARAPDEKKTIKARMGEVKGQIDALSIQLKKCVIVNGPQPNPATTPSLSVAGIEIVQSIQIEDNRIPIVDGPAVVRVRVDSGIRNNFNAGDGLNGWPGVRGSLTVSDVVTGQVMKYSSPSPIQVTANRWKSSSATIPAESLNFLIGIPVGSAKLDDKGRCLG